VRHSEQLAGGLGVDQLTSHGVSIRSTTRSASVSTRAA
jgi:hypothetical protein